MARLQQFATLCLFTGLIVLCGWIGGNIADYQLRHSLQTRADSSLALALNGLNAELDKQRIVPQLLAGDADILGGLADDRGDFSNIHSKLEAFAQRARSTVIYLIDVEGKTLSSSNYRDRTSFVGYDFSYRPYFRNAMRDGFAEQFAYGAISHEPGLYFAERIGSISKPMGVIATKLDTRRIEDEWKKSGNIVAVTDELGVVLISTVSQWRFTASTPLSQTDIRKEEQRYSPALPLEMRTLDILKLGNGLIQITDQKNENRYIEAHGEFSIASTRLKLIALLPVDRFWSAAVWQGRIIGALSVVFIVLAAFGLIRRTGRQRRHRIELQRRAKELEAGVRERTMALLASNERLQTEIIERGRADDHVIQLREELAQANRLTTLGQITAGIAHEINQPLAAIRTFSENGRKFLDLKNTVKAKENYATIINLTDRLAAITDGLRNFARRGQQKVQRLNVEDPVEGALLILSTPMKQNGIQLVRDVPEQPIFVNADRVGLEQVLVNLLRNARDALTGHEHPVVHLSIARANGRVLIRVADNGAGIAPEKHAELFKPFFSTRTKGLGLGLVISTDIIRDFDGRLSVKQDEKLGGAAFTIDLPEAK